MYRRNHLQVQWKLTVVVMRSSERVALKFDDRRWWHIGGLGRRHVGDRRDIASRIGGGQGKPVLRLNREAADVGQLKRAVAQWCGVIPHEALAPRKALYGIEILCFKGLSRVMHGIESCSTKLWVVARRTKIEVKRILRFGRTADREMVNDRVVSVARLCGCILEIDLKVSALIRREAQGEGL